MDADAIFRQCSRQQRELATRAQLARAGLGPAGLHAALVAGDLRRVRRRVYAQRPLVQPGQYLLSGGRIDPAYLRQAQAVLLELGPKAALRGRSAAVLWCLDMLVEPDVFEVQVPRTQSHVRRADIETRRTTEAVQVISGLRVTDLLGTLRGCAQARPLNEAVAIVDSALRRHAVIAAKLPQHGALGRTIALADPLAGSVLESALRVLLAEAGLPPPRTQYVVRAGRDFVARVDFCWPELGLIVETDGRRWHDPDDVRTFDRRRANACAQRGWRLLRFTWAEVLHEPAYVIETVRAALATSVPAA
jgi:very-short-patch-repair endonuclease